MSDAPKRIFAWKSDIGTGAWISAHDEIIRKNETEYRRADLPPTDEECLRNEKVRALVEVLNEFLRTLDGDEESERASPAQIYLTAWEIRARAALAAIQEGKE
jgi:hypothetical protein